MCHVYLNYILINPTARLSIKVSTDLVRNENMNSWLQQKWILSPGRYLYKQWLEYNIHLFKIWCKKELVANISYEYFLASVVFKEMLVFFVGIQKTEYNKKIICVSTYFDDCIFEETMMHMSCVSFKETLLHQLIGKPLFSEQFLLSIHSLKF